jgi:endonuclease/exonuclease/phosphatase family metal-dependent hydrolase
MYKKKATFLGIFLILCFTFGSPIFLSNQKTEAKTLTLMTFNIGKGGTVRGGASKEGVNSILNSITRMINREGVDVLGLQEVDVRVSRSGYWDEPAELSKRLGWGQRSSRFVGAISLGNGEYGNSIIIDLSRGDIDYRDYKVQRWHFYNSYGEDRAAIAMKIDIEQGKQLWFITTHLSDDTENNYRELQQLFEKITTLDEDTPILLCGDFNLAEPVSENDLTPNIVYLAMTLGLLGFEDLGPEGVATLPSKGIKIDYMFLRDPYGIFNTLSVDRVKCEDLSDHHAIKIILSY